MSPIHEIAGKVGKKSCYNQVLNLSELLIVHLWCENSHKYINLVLKDIQRIGVQHTACTVWYILSTAWMLVYCKMNLS